MAKMKTEFYINTYDAKHRGGSKVSIVGSKPDNKPYISFKIGQFYSFGSMEGADLERFAVNILKALKSKRLKP